MTPDVCSSFDKVMKKVKSGNNTYTDEELFDFAAVFLHVGKMYQTRNRREVINDEDVRAGRAMPIVEPFKRTYNSHGGCDMILSFGGIEQAVLGLTHWKENKVIKVEIELFKPLGKELKEYPFDIVMRAANEYGARAEQLILGVTITKINGLKIKGNAHTLIPWKRI